jgi:Flp pilus assembly protein TadD
MSMNAGGPGRILMKRLFYPAAVAALLLTSLVLPVAAQIGTPDPDSGGLGTSGIGRRGRYTISGSVRDAGTDRPMDFVTVKLWTLSAGATATTTTGSSGNFTFTDVPGGTYYLVVEETGYQNLQEEVNVNGRATVGVQLLLRRTAVDAAPGAATISARDLTIPKKAREAMVRGISLANDKLDYKGSIEQFQRAIKEFPDYYEAYFQIGLVYEKLEDTAKAEENMRKSIDVSKRKFTDALSALAFLYSGEKRFADAEPVAREAVALNPNLWDAQLELARALHGLERSEEAETSALSVLRLKPDFVQIHLLLANIHLKMRNYQALLQDLDNYLKAAPDTPEAVQARQMREQVTQLLSQQESAKPAEPQP